MSPSEPPTRMSEPSVSRYASTIHCWAARPPPRSRWIGGSATLTTEPSMNTIDEPRIARDAACKRRPERRHVEATHDVHDAEFTTSRRRMSPSMDESRTRGASDRPRCFPRDGRGRPLVACVGQGRSGAASPARSRPSEAARRRSCRTSGWRIYTVAATMPIFEPATWRLRIGGLVEQQLDADLRELRALPQASQVSDFHCVTGWTVDERPLARRPLQGSARAAQPLPEAHALQFVSAEQPYVDYLTLEQARLPDVMLAYEMDGKPLPREHGAPRAARDPGDVRLQERQVGRAEINLVPGSRARLLGEPRLRPRRVGRPLERLRLCELGTSSASRAPSARCTG